jgi:hypothetical protein
MPYFIPFPKIGQFNTIVQGIISGERFRGIDANGQKLFDTEVVLPSASFMGTIKLHGTNSAICAQNDTIWLQSRENVITPIKDNCGFASSFSGSEKQKIIFDIVEKLRADHNIAKDKIVCLFGEWVGPGVQKNVAISKLPSKSFFLFAIRVVNPERVITESNQEGSYKEDMWLPITGIRNHSINFFNIEDYQTYSLVIDLNDPKTQVAHIQSLVDAVEKQCPVSKAFGIEGIGEGIVWTTTWKGVRLVFKTKGKEHAVTVHKDGGTVQVDTERLNSLNEFATYAVTEARLNQGIEKVFGAEPLIKEKTGLFIKWITNDIVTEEIDAISSNGLSVKDIQGVIAKKAKEWLHNKIDMPQ